MTNDVVRGIAQKAFNGTLSLECQSDCNRPLVLRAFDEDNIDVGAYNLRPFDPGASPAGNGYLVHMFDRAGGTLLATGTCSQLGVRAKSTLTVTSIADAELVTITYPVRSDETAAITTETRAYRFSDSVNAIYKIQRDAASVQNMLDTLVRAINGTHDYADATIFEGTLPCSELTAYRDSATSMVLEARDGGLWGHAVTVTTTATASWSPAGNLAGATGNAGLQVYFAGAALPESLLVTGRSTRRVLINVFGLDDQNNPTKILTGPALLYASGTVLPVVTP